MSGVCYQFQKGECTRGDSCRFSHEMGDGSMPAYAPRRANICFAFQKGECDRGDACRFSHDMSGAPAPMGGGDAWGGAAPGGYQQQPRRVQECYAFQKGECDRGNNCRFSHGGAPAGGNGAFANFGGGQQRKVGVCFAFEKGECDRGNMCRFSHGEFRPRPSGICFKFQTGECDRGDTCRFAHEIGAPDAMGGGAPREARPQGVCFAFQKGECQRGDGCRFSHIMEMPAAY